MRVAMITAFPSSPDSPVGGVEAVSSCLVRALLAVRPDVDLHVIRVPAETEGAVTREGDPPYTLHGVRCVWHGAQVLPGFGPRRRIEEILRRLQPDVVHVQDVAFYLDGRRWPSVLTVHGIQERDALFRGNRFARTRAWLLGRMLRPARARYAHIIAIVGYVAQQLEGSLRGRCHFIPNPIDEAFFEFRRRESGPRILFVGMISPRKNVHGILEAFGLLRAAGIEAELRLAGPRMARGYDERIEVLIDRLGVRDRLTFLGRLDRRALRAEMETARCLVLPSFQETAPMVVSEAGAMGIPAVVSPAGGAAEMVVHGHTGLVVDACNAASIADGLRLFVEDAAIAAEFGERARQRAQVHHPRRVACKILTVYEMIRAESGRSGP